MRILIYSYNYHPEPIGIAPLMTELAEGLAARGHEIRVVTGMPNYPQRKVYSGYRGKLFCTEKINNVTIQRSWIWISPKPGLLTRVLFDGSFVITSLFQALRGKRPDLILLTIPPLPVAVPASLLSKLYSCPVIVNLQDILPEAAVHVGLLKNKFAIRVFEQLERYAYRVATAITVIAPDFAPNLTAKGVPSNKIHHIPNWVNTNLIRPLPKEDNEFRINYGLGGKFIALYSGNIALTQGLETVIDAAKYLENNPEILFVIVGEEKSLSRLQNYCNQKKVTNVRMIPFQSRHLLPVMLAAADVGLVIQKQNVISFNLPSKIQILLSSGRPIIASVPSSGAAAKVITQSQGGLVVNAEDPQKLSQAILMLQRDSGLAKKLGKQGRQFAIDNYEFDTVIDSYENLFTKLTSLSRQDSPVLASSSTSHSKQ